MFTIIRIVSFCVMAVLALSTPFPVFLCATIIYAALFDGGELFVVSTIVDALMSPGAPLYTLSVGGVLVGWALVRPYLSWYTGGHEVV